MSFCNLKSARSIDDEDFIIDDSFSSDYYNYDEGFRTNSSSSIKWSVDARKQNEDDWLSIERILYGEEELPEDEKTREEFQLWMKAFPHLRVTGKKIEVPLKVRQINPVEFYEEIIAIDPPQLECDSFKLLDQELNEKLSLRKSSAKNQLKNDNLEKLLRITSSGISGRNNNHNHKPQSVRKYVDKTSTVIVKQNSNGSRLSKIQERDLEKLSYSASSRPILNVKFLFKKPESVVVLDQNPKVKSASSKLPLYELRSLDQPHKSHQEILATKSASLHTKNVNLIHLPPFNYDLDFQGIIQGRSIQSAFNGKKHV